MLFENTLSKQPGTKELKINNYFDKFSAPLIRFVLFPQAMGATILPAGQIVNENTRRKGGCCSIRGHSLLSIICQ